MDNLISDPGKPETGTARSTLSTSGRIFAALENAWFQRVVGMLALVFSIVDGRYLTILSLLILLSIHRAKSLAGFERGKQALIYGIALCVSVTILWVVGNQWNRSRDNSPFIKAIAEAVGAKITAVAGKLAPSLNATPPTVVAPPPVIPPPLPKPKPKVLQDPRYATIIEANALAEKIENVGDDYIQQINAQRVASAQRQMHSIPAKESDNIAAIRMGGISKYERERYEKKYLGEALSLRSSMLELIPDVPLYGLDTTFSETLYREAVPGLGYKAVAENLKNLATAYKAKLDSMPSAASHPK